jgi:hypothetical protein
MTETNPYEPPTDAAPLNQRPRKRTLEVPTPLPEDVADELRATRPWMRLNSISGLMVAAVLLVLGVKGCVNLAARPRSAQPVLGEVRIGTVISYFIFGAGIGIASLRLFRLSSSIRRLDEDATMANLRLVFHHNRAFWRVAGQAAILVLGYLFLLLALVLLFALVLHPDSRSPG